MHTELICVGSELLMGHLNTDSAFIGQKLAELGIKLNLETSVRDDKTNMETIFQEALKRSSLIIITGGLGPTFDDLTRPVLADVLEKKLLFNKEVMGAIAYLFAQRDIVMPKENEKQAYIIEGTKVIPNKTGTAPGMIIELNNKPASGWQASSTIIVLPGPPREVQPMMKDTVMPFLKNKFKGKIIKTYVLHVAGVTECEVDQRIKNIVETEKRLEGAELEFSLLAHPSVVEVKIVGLGNNEMVIEGLIGKAVEELKECLKNDIFGENDQTMESAVGYLLGKKRATLAIAESCTGGLLGNIITNSPGSSLYFKGGIVAYSNEMKKNILKVPDELLIQHGAVSEPVALAMAKGARDLCKSDFTLAVTGIAGPRGATPEKPVGLVYIALAAKDEEIVKEYHFIGSRQEIKFVSAMAALDLLRRKLL
ncbi:MAG: competence/damage-inducible protein A [bacterium]